MNIKLPAVYIMASKPNGTLYVGVTSNLVQRIYQHKESIIVGFASKHVCKNLVYYEFFENMLSAIAREKNLKASTRTRKLKFINNFNPEWNDLYITLL